MKPRPPLHASLPRRKLGGVVFQRQAMAFRLRRHGGPHPASATAVPLRDPFTLRALALLRPGGDAPH